GPDGTTAVDGEIRRFIVAQDTGGAIRGAARADFFWGAGDDAAARAGVMKQSGRLYFVAPKSRLGG
ncbi:MAG: 3D domain-containing protein, partial [Acidobacteriota bacterium]